MDSFTPDNEPYDVHKIFLKNDVLIVENLIDLNKLSGKRFQCFIMPMKITNADGAPCRIIAISDWTTLTFLPINIFIFLN